ncbi:membrane protein [Paenibacillus swuensis]|uniref:Membrane protein n=1 Tax=Paenibacillus swuensis TaxID=1178515 RepID=A0A172THE9_9BACL|nr:DMT family transporter [Paenibacillus swuensis]ANE46479.1 membrane protein [Paenibacillus swuensis]
MSKKGMYYAGLVLVAVIWGANFGVSRAAMETFDPILFAFLRFAGALPILFLLLKLKEGNLGVSWKDAIQLAGIGLIGITALEIMVLYSIQYTTLANASLLNVAPWPIFAALFAPLITKEKLTSRVIIGGAAAMTGVFLIILGGGEGIDLSSGHLIGNLLAFSVSIIGALSNVLCIPLMKKYSPLRVSTWYILFGTILMFPLTLGGAWGDVKWGLLTPVHYAGILYNVLICTVVAFIVWNGSMLRVGAARANFFRYAVPAASGIAGYFFFDEAISAWQIGGTVFMAAGLVWISLEKTPVRPSHGEPIATKDAM